jgi:hypothetical protein
MDGRLGGTSTRGSGPRHGPVQPLLGSPKKIVLWIKVGGCMIAIDTLVHNILHRTGILHRFKAKHQYGLACYRLGGCSDSSQSGLDICNGNRINDRERCANHECRMRLMCDRVALPKTAER